jgi:outer membrane receptor protein involved in Fe transport
MVVTTTPTFGQAVYGRIYGTVSDPSAAAIVGAKVTVTSVGQGTFKETTTNEEGNYNVPNLIPGLYDVVVETVGFKKFEAKGIQVSADAAARVDAAMELGEATSTVTVTAESTPLLKTDRADVSFDFTQKEIQETPVLNRNFTEFQLLSPGTQSFTWQHAAPENPQQSLQIAVNGQHFSGTAFQLDGTDNRDPILGIIVVNPNLESVGELKITTQNYDAEFGQASAAVITAQTRSGTNDFHGSAFWYRRNDLLQARDPFTQSTPNPVSGRLIPESLRNEFGGSFGGPIMKERLFFFGDYQGVREKVGNSVLTSVPTALVRSTCLDPLSATCDLSEYLSAGQIFDPATGNPDGTGRTAFAGNIIPNNRISPEARALLALLPAPTAPGIFRNFSSGGNGGNNSDAFNVRIDYPFSQDLNIMGRYSLADYELSGAGLFDTSSVAVGGPGLGLAGFGGQSAYRNQSLSTGFNYTLGTTWLTDFRFGYFRYAGEVNPNGVGTTPAADAGIPGLNMGDDLTSGMPGFFIGDRDQLGGDIAFGYALSDRLTRCNCPLIQTEDQFQFVNNWTNVRGDHQIKFGGDIRYARNLRVPSDAHRSGELSFTKNGTGEPTVSGSGVALATYLLGNVTTFSRYVSTVDTAGERQKRWFFYGQDTWRATPKLTVNFGLRWEIYFPQTVTCDGCGGFVELSTGETRVAGIGGIGRDMDVKNAYKNFAPRLGVAYQLNDKTVVRMGYGRSYDIGVFGSVFGHSVTQNLPVLGRQALNGPVTGSSFEAAFTLAVGPTPLVFPTVGSNGRFTTPDGVNPFIQPEKMRLGHVDSWNATVQYQITPTMTAEVAYVGNKGTHVFAGNGPDYNLNQPTNDGFTSGFTTNERRPFHSCTAPTGAGTCYFGMPFGWSQDLRYHANDSSNHYNALQTKIEKRFSQGYTFTAHYTLSRNTNFDSNGYNFHRDVTEGVADFNRTHVFVLNGLWELPFGQGKRWLADVSKAWNYLVGGWQINTTTNWSSGLPFSFSYNSCGADIDTSAGPCRPNRIGKVNYGGRNQWFEISSITNLANGQSSGPWERPAFGEFGDSERNEGRGPRFFNTDLSVFKNFAITEIVKGQFRFEVFNIFNNVNLGTPGVFFQEFGSGGSNCVDCNAASDGRITGLGGRMRRAQFAIKLSF